MRRLVWLSVLAFALAAPAVGFALSGTGDGTLSVKPGDAVRLNAELTANP